MDAEKIAGVTITKEPEIPIDLLVRTSDKERRVNRWLPHLKGQEVTCQLWQVLPCNFRFLLNGRLICGSGCPFWIYILIVLVSVFISFIVYDVLPYKSWTAGFNGAFVALMTIIALYSLFQLVTKDPGYMVPHWFSKQSMELLTVQKLSFEQISKKYGFTSYCCICKIFQKPDTFHCTLCHACIDGGDHHCKLLGTCVGRRNYGDFITFIVSSDFGLWFAFFVSLIHLIQNYINRDGWYAFSHCVTLYLVISTMIFPPGGLLVISALPYFHLRLIFYGLTLEQERNGDMLEAVHLRKLPLTQKLLRFFQNFYERVIKTPPPSQIPLEVRQLQVKILGIPRTKEVQRYFVEMQGHYKIRDIKIKFNSKWMEETFSKYRMRLIQRDLDTYGSVSAFVVQIRQENKNQFMELSIPQSESLSSSPSTSPETNFTILDAPRKDFIPLRIVSQYFVAFKNLTRRISIRNDTANINDNYEDV